MATSTEIGSYALAMYVNASATGHIKLWDRAGKPIGQLYFVGDDKPPESTCSEGFYRFYYRQHDYPAVVDMLRNEGPVYARWFNTSGALTTSTEPIGEGETLM